MKKSVVTLGVVLALANLSSVVQAAGGANTWYAGAKAGWSNYYNSDIDRKVSHDSNTQTRFDTGRNNVGGGVFAGYQVSDWMSLEGGYDYLGNMGLRSSNSTGAKMENQGLQLGVKLSLPLTSSWDVYTRLGAMGWRAEVKNAGHSTTESAVSPLAALGTELALSDDWAMRMEYQYVPNVGKEESDGITVDNGLTSLAVVYRFGSNPITSAPPVPPAPISTQQLQTFSLQSDLLFAHDSAVLTPAGQQAVVQLYQKLRSQGADKLSMTVKGYTDSTGPDSYNQLLSMQRAQAVVDVLMKEGMRSDSIKVEGRGEREPVTGTQCESIEARAALIECLAPDRRVVVEVSGQVPTIAGVDSNQETA